MTLSARRLASIAAMTIACAASSGLRSVEARDGAAVTWYRDVLPVVQARCQGCHVSGGIAPFPLVTYEDALGRHAAMASAVETRFMPPWTAADGCQSYQNSRRLSEAEIDTIVSWSRGGTEAGDPADAPRTTPSRPELPWVDASLDAGADYVPDERQGKDDYRCFMLDPALPQERDLIGFDITPGVRRMVHHVLLFGAARADAEAADRRDAGLGWTCFGGPNTAGVPSVVGGWVSGTPVVQYPPGTGVPLPAGNVLVMQLHYNLQNGPAVPDRTAVKLQYARERVPRPAVIFPIADFLFAIPPRTIGYTTSVSVPMPVAGTLWGLAPHMHTLGRQVVVEKDSTCLVNIPTWDFHWQQPYLFSDPAGLPVAAGSRLKLTCSWDNPTDRTVLWGEGTSDEMCINFFYMTR